jgi:hypothetical protein
VQGDNSFYRFFVSIDAPGGPIQRIASLAETRTISFRMMQRPLVRTGQYGSVPAAKV